MVYFRSAPLPSPGLDIDPKASSALQIHQAIDHDANSTPPLKGKHHMAFWPLCLNTLTNRPTQGLEYSLCPVRPPASRLARFP